VTDPAAFYLKVSDDEFRTTAATASPWDESLQHGGPPAALLARAVSRARPDDSMRITRLTIDMLGGIPQGTIRTEASVVRPGKRVELIEARLWADDKLAVTATAWRIRVDPGASAAESTEPDLAPPLPSAQPQRFFDGVSPAWGYGRAIEWRYVSGGFDRTGPSEVWARPRIPLVEGEPTSPAERLMILADSTNGLSVQLPIAEWLSIPPTLSVTLLRPPAAEWMFLRAHTTIGPDGVGIARGQMYDESGYVAETAQPLLVQRRT
jgi:hypothetical protein